MAFTVLGAVAKLERPLILQCVKARLRNARAKGKRLGRPRAVVDTEQIATPRKQGRPWSEICEETGLSKSTAQRSVASLPKKVS
jgi:DNA invertase Pin-like site-specific DNA recombinase